MILRGTTLAVRHRWLVITVVGIVVATAGVVGVAHPFAHADLGAPQGIDVSWGDSTGLVTWQPVAGATRYEVTLIRVKDMGIMEQKQVPATQLHFDAQGIWPGQQYEVAVRAIDSSGGLGQPGLSAQGEAQPLARSAYNGFLDTANQAQGAVDNTLWDVRLGQDNPPNQGGAFVNNQLHFHIEAGDRNGDQTFTSMRARALADWRNGRTLRAHGEVDLKGDRHNWFAVTLSAQAIGGDQLVDFVDRPLAPSAPAKLELFDDQDGLHLIDTWPGGAVELGRPYTGGYHTNNVRDTLLWTVSASHVQVTVDGALAFDTALPQPLSFATGYLTLIAEDYPGNGGGVIPATACDAPMADCNIWHLDSWGFDAPTGVEQPQTLVGYTPGCGPSPSAETQTVTFAPCGRLDNTGGFGWGSGTVSTTLTLPSPLPAAVVSAGLAFDAYNYQGGTLVALNGGAPVSLGAPVTRSGSWQALRVALPAGGMRPGVNTVTFSGAVTQLANLQLEAALAAPFIPAQLPPEPAPLGIWQP